MNEPQFDRWARALSDPASRCQTILASFPGGLALLRGGHEAMAKKKAEQHKMKCGPCKNLQRGGAHEVTAKGAVRRMVCRSSLNQEMPLG